MSVSIFPMQLVGQARPARYRQCSWLSVSWASGRGHPRCDVWNVKLHPAYDEPTRVASHFSFLCHTTNQPTPKRVNTQSVNFMKVNLNYAQRQHTMTILLATCSRQASLKYSHDVKWECTLNEIPNFHVTHNFSLDNMHTVRCALYNLCNIKHFFTYDVS